MKKVCIIILVLVVCIINTRAQFTDKNCYYGITFEFSQNPNWGQGELVITDVEPNSPAEQAGIKVNDIIMEINGKATYLRDDQTITSWLFDNTELSTKFTIRNMNNSFKEYELVRSCINTNAVSEKQLSEIYTFYSLENTNNQTFTLPLHVTSNPDADYTYYHTYNFYNEPGMRIPPVDEYITNLISKELQSKGMVRDTKNPDIIVQTYYAFNPNEKYRGSHPSDTLMSTYRFDKDRQEMVSVPIIDATRFDIETRGKYIIEFGFSFYDKKTIDTTRVTQVWDCNITEHLLDKYSLEEYARIMTPLMLMQFPYSENKTSSKYEIKFNKYNYTGLFFNSNDLITVQDVIPHSPAYEAGIRSGYVIKKIDGKIFDHTKESLSSGYKRFITETMIYRDPSIRFTISSGYTDCMFWNKKYYANIAKEFANPQNKSSFAYLYNFESYVNSNKTSSELAVEASDGIQNRLFYVNPKIRKSITIKVKD